jgi:TonB-dependent starch-binding outer membrane protein SusC
MRTKLILVVLLAVAYAGVASAQKGTKILITGIVLNEQEKPVSGATIFIDESDTRVKTNKKGEFKVQIPADSKAIVAVLAEVGITQEEIGDKREFRLVLNKAHIIELMQAGPEDELINVGYGAVKRKHLTESVGRIDGSNPKFAAYRNIYDMIKGEVPGVVVQGSSITIRGAGSINASTEPLYVVDGVIVDRIDDIAPAEVRTIEVLKGSSTAIYGSRGSNGVILIRRVSSKR